MKIKDVEQTNSEMLTKKTPVKSIIIPVKHVLSKHHHLSYRKGTTRMAKNWRADKTPIPKRSCAKLQLRRCEAFVMV